MSKIDNNNSLLSVPTGSLEIPQLPCKNSLLLSLVIPTYKERENIKNIIKMGKFSSFTITFERVLWEMHYM